MNNPFYVWSEGNRAVKNNLIMNLSNLFVPNLHHEIIYNEPLIKLKEFQDNSLKLVSLLPLYDYDAVCFLENLDYKKLWLKSFASYCTLQFNC